MLGRQGGEGDPVLSHNVKARLQSGIQRLKQNQTGLMLLLTLALGITLITLMVVLFSNRGDDAGSSTKERGYKTSLTRGASRVDPKELWVEKFSNEQNLNTKRLDKLEKMITELSQKDKVLHAQQPQKNETTFETSSEISSSPPNAPPSSPSSAAASSHAFNPDEVIEGLRGEMKNALQGDQGPPLDPFASLPQGGSPSPSSLSQTNQPPQSQPLLASEAHLKKRPHTKGIKRTAINLLRSKASKTLKSYDNTIPAGTFAQALLLGGVDASTSIQASNDPRPILLRITDPGTLPRRFRSDLMGCHVLAASYGDISSERVFMRLEKLTCTERTTGEIVEMAVSGYVAGEDGRAGLRGAVVDRAGESVRHAAIGGFLGSIGNFFSQPNNPITYSLGSGLAQTNPLSNGQLLTHGLGKGAGSALDKYADFYIKRAEQMQPVIQVQAGRVVDIVFTQGVPFEDSAARAALVHAQDQNRFAQLHQTSPQTSYETEDKPLEAWQPTASSN